MARSEDSARPWWWPEWVPDSCRRCGQLWRPGSSVRSRHRPCSCPGAKGVLITTCEVWYCAAIGCVYEVWAPSHRPGSEKAERPRVF